MGRNNIIIYTAISNDYDNLRDPLEITPNADYICFSDTGNQESDIWEIREFPNDNLDPVRKCRYVKALSHKVFLDYDYSVWIDGNILIKKDLTSLIKKYLIEQKENFVTFKHPTRNCIYREAESCKYQNKDDEFIINKQVNYYKKEDYPSNNGLLESRVILRKNHSDKLFKTMSDWWHEINNKSRRDQLSFNYVAWKNNFSYNYFENYIIKNSYFDLLGHNQKGFKKIRQVIREYIFLNRNKSKLNKYIYKNSKMIWRNLNKVLKNV